MKCKRVLNFSIFTVAIALAVLVTVWPHERMTEILYATRFFEVMLPVLAVGALVKYLCYGSGNNGECK